MLKKRIAGNLAANVFLQAVIVIVQLASIPLFLRFWSKEEYGEWLILYSIPGYMAFAEAGLSTLAANDASIFMVEGQVDLARRSLQTAFGALSFVCLMLMIVTGMAAWLVPWSMFGLSRLSSGDTGWCVFLLGIYTIVGLLHMLYLAQFRAANHYPRIIYLIGLCRLVELVASGVCLWMVGSVVDMAIALLAVRIVFALIMHFEGLRLSPSLRLGLAGFSWHELRRTWRLSLSFMAFPVGNAFYFQGLTLLAGWLLGPANVVVLNTTRALTRAIVQFISILKNSILPEFSRLFGVRDFAKAKRLNELAFELALLAALGFAGTLFFIGPWILKVWTHGAVIVGRGLLVLFLGGAVLNSLWNVSSGLLLGVNRHSRLAVLYLCTSFASLVVAAILVPETGIRGIAWAMILCELLLVPFSLSEACSVLEQPLGQFLRDAFCLQQSRALLRRQFRWPWQQSIP